MSQNVVPIGLPANLFAARPRSSRITRASAARRLFALRRRSECVVNYLSNIAEAAETVKICQEKGARAIAVQGDVSEFAAAPRSRSKL